MNDIIDEKIKLKKEFIKRQVVDENIKQKLKQAMKEEYNKKESFSDSKFKKVIGIAACLIIVSSATFAGNIGNFLSNLFENTEIKNDQIINPEAIIKIDSEYVINDGIGLNVAYLYEEGEFLYIVLNVQGTDNAQDIMISEFEIKDLTNNKTYSNTRENNNFEKNIVQYKCDSKMIFIKMEKFNDLNLINELELNINNLIIKNYTEEYNQVRGNWMLKIKKP